MFTNHTTYRFHLIGCVLATELQIYCSYIVRFSCVLNCLVGCLITSLLMYGCMALMNERYEEAETFFEAATCAESKSVIAWTMLGKILSSQLGCGCVLC